MYLVEDYSKVRRAHFVAKMSIRQIANDFGMGRETVTKMLNYSIPPCYRKSSKPKVSVLDSHKEKIHQILEDDKIVHKKQHHSSKRIYDRLVEEDNFSGSYHTVRRYVNTRRKKTQEVFVPLTHSPGSAQADFGEADVIIGGVKQRAHFMVIDLPYSNACFLKAYPVENTEAFLDAHKCAFEYFEGVPREIVYDNSKIAVTQVLKEGNRIKTSAFLELQSHYLFEDKFGRPGKGNDKGKVEGMVGFYRRNFMVPMPQFRTYKDFNEYLQKCCDKRMNQVVQRKSDPIHYYYKKDKENLLPVPSCLFEACVKINTQVDSTSLVNHKTNKYSVPVEYAHRDVTIKSYPFVIKIICGCYTIANHTRSYEKYDEVYDPLHYLPLIEQKVESLDQAAPLQKWNLPVVFGILRRTLEGRLGKKGKREYVQILRLISDFSLNKVQRSINKAFQFNAISFDVIKHFILSEGEVSHDTIDIERYPHLKFVQVKSTKTSDYMSLLSRKI
jgi:transposase